LNIKIMSDEYLSLITHHSLLILGCQENWKDER